MADPGTNARRALAKLVLIFAGIWLLLIVGQTVVLAQGKLHVPVINWPAMITPGFAFAPAAYYAIKVQLSGDQAAQKALLGRAWLYAAIGIVLAVAVIVILYQMNAS